MLNNTPTTQSQKHYTSLNIGGFRFHSTPELATESLLLRGGKGISGNIKWASVKVGNRIYYCIAARKNHPTIRVGEDSYILWNDMVSMPSEEYVTYVSEDLFTPQHPFIGKFNSPLPRHSFADYFDLLYRNPVKIELEKYEGYVFSDIDFSIGCFEHYADLKGCECIGVSPTPTKDGIHSLSIKVPASFQETLIEYSGNSCVSCIRANPEDKFLPFSSFFIPRFEGQDHEKDPEDNLPDYYEVILEL